MEYVNVFKQGDIVNYRNGMDFKDFSGKIEECINYKGHWHYLVKDSRDNTIKRVGEKFLSLNVEDQVKQRKSKFKAGDFVKYINGKNMNVFNGIVERSINNYQGQWQYIVKDTKINEVKRIDEKYLELNNQSFKMAL